MPPEALPTVLERLVAGRRGDLPDIRARLAHVDCGALPRSTRSLYDALRTAGGRASAAAQESGRGQNAVILECKSASPSLGVIREHYEPGAIARVYSRYAAGISVLCEPHRFGGDYDHLATVAASTHLPVLCKDFVIDVCQVHAARYFGADAILLMLSIVDDAQFAVLAAEARRLGLDILTEAITEEEVARAVRHDVRILGINHRDLHDLSIDLTRSERLAGAVPPDVLVVAESGIRDAETVRRLGGHATGFLVGSQLTAQPDVDRAARELVYGSTKVCGLTRPTEAQVARACGAVHGGLVFEASSPRAVTRAAAAQIMAAEPDLAYVAVSRRAAGYADLVQPGIAAVQVQAPYAGSLAAERALVEAVRAEVGAGVEVWRAVSMTEPDGPAVAEALVGIADRLVLDAGAGGSGRTFDWAGVPQAVKRHALLAGGLGPHNVTAALAVGCLGLDLNSGLEYGPGAGERAGRKDAAAIRATFEAIRGFTY